MLKSSVRLIVLLYVLKCICGDPTILEEKKRTDNNEWWKNTIIYQVYIRSFQDSDGDGVGDLKGVISKLDYFVELGVETLWIGPLLKSPMVDMGYDVDNFTLVDPLFGTMDDFDELISEMNKRNLKLIIDFIPNHSSDKCEWFQKSIKRDGKYENYYVWRDAKNQKEVMANASVTPIVPNNWLNVFQYSSWTWHEERKQFYFHQFDPLQPDFNIRNPEVKKELLDILEFWMDKGVAGFRCDAIPRLFENETFADEPYLPGKEGSTNSEDIIHIYTKDQPEIFETIIEWRRFVDDYSKRQDNTYPRILVPEVYAETSTIKQYYGNSSHPASHLPLNFGFITFIDKNKIVQSIDTVIRNWITITPKNGSANWVVENHDNNRIPTAYGPEMVPLFTALKLALPGVEVTYYGSEIGMHDTKLRQDQIRDAVKMKQHISRDSGRCPMQWNSSINAGFTRSNKSWLPVNPNYYKLNVEAQKKIPTSNYNFYKKMSQLRKTDTLKYGGLRSYNVSQSMYIIERFLSNHESYIVVMNFGSETNTVVLSDVINNLKYKQLYVYLGSENSDVSEGSVIYTNYAIENPLRLRPQSTVVLTDKEIVVESSTNGCSQIDSKIITHVFCALLILQLIFKNKNEF